MHYFDHRLLGQYLATGVDVKVFVDGHYYVLASEEDVQNPVVGYGYDLNGKTYKFDYRGIQHILINGVALDMEQLEKAYEKKSGDGKDSDAKKTDSKKTDTATEEPPAEEEPKKEEPPAEEEPKKEESIQFGDFVQNIDPVNNFFRTRGSVVLVENDFVTYEYYSNDSKGMTTKTVPLSSVKKIK